MLFNCYLRLVSCAALTILCCPNTYTINILSSFFLFLLDLLRQTKSKQTMAAWNLFGSKKPSRSHKSHSDKHHHHHKLFRSLSDDSLVTSSSAGSSMKPGNIHEVSTQSSAKDIFKLVSAANAAEAASSSPRNPKLPQPKVVC